MSVNKRRKLDIFKEDIPSSSYYNSISHYEEFVFPQKQCCQSSSSNLIFSFDERESSSYSKEFSSLEYSQEGNYDEYPDILGEENLLGSHIIDFGDNLIPSSATNQQLIDYESIDFKEYVGHGNFSDVWSAILESDIDEDALVAVKVLKPSKSMNSSMEGFFNELEILRKLNQDDNAYVLKLLGFCKSPQLCILTELLDTSLFDLIHDPIQSRYLDDFQNKIKVALCIARGIYGINEKSNILHNDLTSKNILLKAINTDDDSEKMDYLVKITDFGLSSFMDSSQGPTKRGNARWRSPEQTSSNQFTKKGEVWSFGIIFWELLTKQLPYASIKESKLIAEKVANKTLSLEMPSNLPPVISELLADCLTYDQEKRVSIEDVVSVLENYYLTTYQEKLPQ